VPRRLLCAALFLIPAALARHTETAACSTTAETSHQTLFLHRQAPHARSTLRPQLAAAPDYDIGNIAIIQDRDGVVARQNQFNLDNNTLTFTPSGAQYRYSVAAQGYDSAAAANGAPLAALDDDDSRLVALPFSFAFFGGTYTSVYVNSDGNLTFTAGDSASTQRSLGRMTAGPPRISPLFDDLDPSKTAGGVRVLSEAARVVVSWVTVPEYSSSGTSVPETFQVRLYPDGRIEFAYNGINPAIESAVVGISPGGIKGSTTLVDFRNDPSATYSSTVAEVFANGLQIDIVTVAQRFYQTHEDAYDYLVVYNNMGIAAAGEGTIAFENTVRSSGTGYNVPQQDAGAEYGSPTRLQSILQMGNLTQYPADPTALVPARSQQGDTPLSILAHETGHLFLAFTSVYDPSTAAGGPMLGYQLAHWSFLYDSEASVMEGERILDRGSSVSPQFKTTDTVQAYSPLDQYLMGFRASAGVSDTFYVNNPRPGYPAVLHPLSGITLDGTKVNVSAADIVRAAGRRTPDSTVAQRHFRFAFILVVPTGSQPDTQQIDTYRRQFEPFFAQASSGNAAADTSLKRSLSVSAPGVVAGMSAAAVVALTAPPSADLTITFTAPNGNAGVPKSVTIPSGARTAPFTISGLKTGVEELQATPSDPAYETAYARVQVADASLLQLTALTTSPVTVELTDSNRLVYAGARITATASAGGSVSPAAAVTDARGIAGFQWTPGPAPVNTLHVAAEAFPSVALDLEAGSAVPVIYAVVNAASWEPGLCPGALQTIFGANLAGAKVLVGDTPASLLYGSDTQINFLNSGTVTETTVTVVSSSGTRASFTTTSATYQPGIFAITGGTHAGDSIEILCTGLGPATISPTVFIGSVPVQPSSSALAPGYAGLYKVNAQIPATLGPGTYPVMLSVNLAHSNSVNLTVQ
jgi:uncharacterized protein (TIGR03437 family)